ncbi:hypothetical protein DIPPA_25866 [Diplonema papillatum]|nr:hypothetical protein DIPPA_25866 [Diplonema papillatum]
MSSNSGASSGGSGSGSSSGSNTKMTDAVMTLSARFPDVPTRRITKALTDTKCDVDKAEALLQAEPAASSPVGKKKKPKPKGKKPSAKKKPAAPPSADTAASPDNYTTAGAGAPTASSGTGDQLTLSSTLPGGAVPLDSAGGPLGGGAEGGGRGGGAAEPDDEVVLRLRRFFARYDPGASGMEDARSFLRNWEGTQDAMWVHLMDIHGSEPDESEADSLLRHQSHANDALPQAKGSVHGSHPAAPSASSHERPPASAPASASASVPRQADAQDTEAFAASTSPAVDTQSPVSQQSGQPLASMPAGSPTSNFSPNPAASQPVAQHASHVQFQEPASSIPLSQSYPSSVGGHDSPPAQQAPVSSYSSHPQPQLAASYPPNSAPSVTFQQPHSAAGSHASPARVLQPPSVQQPFTSEDHPSRVSGSTQATFHPQAGYSYPQQQQQQQLSYHPSSTSYQSTAAVPVGPPDSRYAPQAAPDYRTLPPAHPFPAEYPFYAPEAPPPPPPPPAGGSHRQPAFDHTYYGGPALPFAPHSGGLSAYEQQLPYAAAGEGLAGPGSGQAVVSAAEALLQMLIPGMASAFVKRHARGGGGDTTESLTSTASATETSETPTTEDRTKDAGSRRRRRASSVAKADSEKQILSKIHDIEQALATLASRSPEPAKPATPSIRAATATFPSEAGSLPPPPPPQLAAELPRHDGGGVGVRPFDPAHSLAQQIQVKRAGLNRTGFDPPAEDVALTNIPQDEGASDTLGGVLSALAGAHPVPSVARDYATLVARQQRLLDASAEQREQARVLVLEEELKAARARFAGSQKQVGEQLSLIAALQRQLRAEAQRTTGSIDQLEAVSEGVASWAAELRTQQQAYIDGETEALRHDVQQQQESLAKAVASNDPEKAAKIAALTAKQKDIFRRASALAEQKKKLAAAEPLVENAVSAELLGIEGSLKQAQTRQQHYQEALGKLTTVVAAAAGVSSPQRASAAPPQHPPLPYPAAVPQRTTPTPPVPVQAGNQYSNTGFEARPPPGSRPYTTVPTRLQQPRPDAVQHPRLPFRTPPPGSSHAYLPQGSVYSNLVRTHSPRPASVASTTPRRSRTRSPSVDEGVAGEIDRLKNVLRLMIKHQAEQAEQQGEMMHRHTALLEKQKLGELARARETSAAIELSAAADRHPRRSRRPRRDPSSSLSPSRSRSISAGRRRVGFPNEPDQSSDDQYSKLTPRRSISKHGKDRHTRHPPRTSVLQPESPKSTSLHRSLHEISRAVKHLKNGPAAPVQYPSYASAASSPPFPTPQQVPPPTPPGENPHKAVLHAFYSRHDPAKIADIDTILARFAGHDNTLFHSLAKKYNITCNPYRNRLVAFYQEHNPSKLCQVDVILHLAEGNEDRLLKKLHQKYCR